MAVYLSLTQPGRSPGYIRKRIKQDVLYNYCRFRDVNFSVSKKLKQTTRVNDALAELLFREGILCAQEKQAYDRAILESLLPIEEYDEMPAEALYRHIHSVRKAVLGAQALEQGQRLLASRGVAFDPAGGIDQRAKKEALLQQCDTVIFALCQAELLEQLRADVEQARKSGKSVWLLHGQPGDALASRHLLEQWLGLENGEYLCFDGQGIPMDRQLQSAVDTGRAVLMVYGEDGLFACRSMKLDCVVTAMPEGYLAQAVTNQLGSPEPCVVYIPKGLDITATVPLTQKTRLTYRHLARLWQAHGDQVYSLSPQELYRRFPEAFVNIYDGTPAQLPIRLSLSQEESDVFGAFDRQLDEQLQSYLGSFDDLQLHCAYYDEALTRQSICYDSSQKQPGILVHAVRVKKAQQAQVIRCEKDVTPRQMFRKMGLPGTGIVSNFLFFMTPKLGILYNDLRADRPYEQADAASGHLDYMLAYRNGKRVETFPLFRKTCLAMKENGQFLFFNFRLGGGSIQVGGLEFSWTPEAVDTERDMPLRVYTPYYSLPDSDADRDTYRTLVGQDRVNLVILQDRLCCVRRGDVVLPSVGVVLSLTAEAAQPLLQKLQPLEDGYYDVSGLELTVRLEPPAQVDPSEWAQVKWAYGGGLSLILDGRGLCDGDHMEQWFRNDGWTSPLSRQTQESNLHSLVKHPRTAIGCTESGDLVVLVYSGRTWRSTGADYREMIAICRDLFPDIRYLMNCDGGGSAMLGMVCDGSFLELSCPSTSSGSCAGQVRPINTVFYIPTENT